MDNRRQPPPPYNYIPVTTTLGRPSQDSAGDYYVLIKENFPAEMISATRSNNIIFGN